MKLLIALPLKTAQYYRDRMVACEATWLKNCPVDYKFFSDAELGLDPNDPKVRTYRTQGMCAYALDHGYDYVFRVDSDTYVWVNRLLACGFEAHDYMGYCFDYPRHLDPAEAITRTAGGWACFWSARAMKFIIAAEPFLVGDTYWGDIWSGKVLGKHGIRVHRDTRFMDGNGVPDAFDPDLPEDHPYVAVHPVRVTRMYTMNPNVCTETIAPDNQLYEQNPDFRYGNRSPETCGCHYCHPDSVPCPRIGMADSPMQTAARTWQGPR